MVRTIVVFVFVTSVCVTAAFSQTVEKENKVDVQKKNSSTEVSGRLLLETKDIEPKLPDMEVKKKAADDKSTQSYGLHRAYLLIFMIFLHCWKVIRH